MKSLQSPHSPLSDLALSFVPPIDNASVTAGATHSSSVPVEAPAVTSNFEDEVSALERAWALMPRYIHLPLSRPASPVLRASGALPSNPAPTSSPALATAAAVVAGEPAPAAAFSSDDLARDISMNNATFFVAAASEIQFPSSSSNIPTT